MKTRCSAIYLDTNLVLFSLSPYVVSALERGESEKQGREGLGNNDNGGIVKGGFVTSRPERFNGASILRE